MKKYKVHFSIFNLFADSQSEVVKLQQLFKALTVLITSGTWLATDANHAIYIGLIGFVVDTGISCLYFEKI